MSERNEQKTDWPSEYLTYEVGGFFRNVYNLSYTIKDWYECKISENVTVFNGDNISYAFRPNSASVQNFVVSTKREEDKLFIRIEFPNIFMEKFDDCLIVESDLSTSCKNDSFLEFVFPYIKKYMEYVT